jgi:hypothetical protein
VSSGQSGSSEDWEVLASALRADATDARSLFAVLATKLEAALGAHVRLRRKAAGLLKRAAGEVVAIEVELGEQLFEAERQGGGVACRIKRRVRGIVLGSEETNVDEWLGRLAQAIAEEARRSAAARSALEELLLR